MPYKPTGRPPGRPPKVVPESATPLKQDRHELQVQPGREIPFDMAPCCRICQPGGWPAGWTSYACEHGVWARRA